MFSSLPSLWREVKNRCWEVNPFIIRSTMAVKTFLNLKHFQKGKFYRLAREQNRIWNWESKWKEAEVTAFRREILGKGDIPKECFSYGRGRAESSGHTSPEWGHFRWFAGNQEDLIWSGNIFNESITGNDFTQRKCWLIFLIWSPAGTGRGAGRSPGISGKASFLDEKTASPFCK